MNVIADKKINLYTRQKSPRGFKVQTHCLRFSSRVLAQNSRTVRKLQLEVPNLEDFQKRRVVGTVFAVAICFLSSKEGCVVSRLNSKKHGSESRVRHEDERD